MDTYLPPMGAGRSSNMCLFRDRGDSDIWQRRHRVRSEQGTCQSIRHR